MKFSIVIPNYNGAQLLKKNLPKVLQAAKGQEIIVVDDASTDESVELVKKHFPKVKLMTHKTNLRFAKTCNQGVKNATGDIVVLLNSDVKPKIDFLKALENHFKNPQVFAVGCLELMETGSRGKATGKFEKGLLTHTEAGDRNPGITLWAFGGSAAFNRKKWLELGGMDYLFRPAYWEDIDLSYRAWKRGWQVLFEPKSQVHHQAESTNIKAFGTKGMKQAAAKNQLLFVWKNIHDKRLILEHLFWLPVHFNKAILTGNRTFIVATLKAVLQLPEAMMARIKEKKESKVSDRKILANFSTKL